MDHEYKKLAVSDILLDQKNPRFVEVSSQREAIFAMLDEQKAKMYELALDIVEYGLDPSKRHIIFKEKRAYIDGDGNRRLTVLKILETPSLIKGHSLHKKFKALSVNNTQSIAEVDCVVFDNRASVRHWLEINHLGEMGGRGQISWNSEQKERFKDEKSVALLAKEFLLKNKLITKKELSAVNITTLERLLSSKPGKQKLSIKKESGGKVSFGKPESLQAVYKALIGENVKSVYYDKDRKDFLNKVLNGEKVSNTSASNSTNKNKRTRRVKNFEKSIFGKALNLKKGTVNNIYRDICEIYEKSLENGHFIEILGFSLRLILDVAAREYFSDHPSELKNKDAAYREYVKIIKNNSTYKSKNTLSINPQIKSLIEEENVEALLGKLAHDSIHVDLGMILNLSIVIGQILEIHFSAEPS